MRGKLFMQSLSSRDTFYSIYTCMYMQRRSIQYTYILVFEKRRLNRFDMFVNFHQGKRLTIPFHSDTPHRSLSSGKRVHFSWFVIFLIIIGVLLSYRGHTYKFEEFLMIWTDELKNREPTTMTVRLQKEVDKYKVHSLLYFWII